MLCCQEFEVKNYDFTLGRLAYESLRLVQDTRCSWTTKAQRTEIRSRKSESRKHEIFKLFFVVSIFRDFVMRK